MRYSVIDNNVRASDIHVDKLYSKELRYAEEYVESMSKTENTEMVCPICGEKMEEIVLKNGV